MPLLADGALTIDAHGQHTYAPMKLFCGPAEGYSLLTVVQRHPLLPSCRRDARD